MVKYQEIGLRKEHKKGNLYPYILGCYPPDSMKHMVPLSVSLVDSRCPRSKPSNNLRVYFEKHESGQKQGIAVCTKWISHLGDLSLRLIEWIELLRAQGVDKIFLHILAVHPNVMKVGGLDLGLTKIFIILFFRYLNITSPLACLRQDK